MEIPRVHGTISVVGVTHDLTHLNAFAEAIPGKGVRKGSDLGPDQVRQFLRHIVALLIKDSGSLVVIDHVMRFTMLRSLGEGVA